MKQIELTSKLVLAIIGLTSVSAILVPTYAVPSVKSADIVNETILSEDIKNGQVNTIDLAPGAVKPNVHRVQGEGVSVPPGQVVSARADCPSGEIVTGGGIIASNIAGDFGSFPLDENTWAVNGATDDDSFNGHIIPFAVCMGASP
jgi:hypothetical protein